MKKTPYYYSGHLKRHTTGWWVVYEEYHSGDNRVWAEETVIHVIDNGDVEPVAGEKVWFTIENTDEGRGARLAKRPVVREIVETPDGVTMIFEINQQWSAEFKNGYAQAIDDIKKMLDEFQSVNPGD